MKIEGLCNDLHFLIADFKDNIDAFYYLLITVPYKSVKRFF